MPMRAASSRKSSPSPCVGGDTAQGALFEEVTLVVEDRHVAEIDAGDGQCAAAVQTGEGRWHQRTDRREEDGGIKRFRGRRIGFARACRTELEGERTSLGRPGHDVDAHPAGQRDLRREMRRSAEAVDAEAPAVGHLGAAQSAVADDAGAQERCRLNVVEAIGQRVGVGLVDECVVGVAAVDIPPGEPGGQTQVLTARNAEAADATGVRQPGHADTIADAPAGAVRPESVDQADHLVAGCDEVPVRDQIALGEMEVGAAHAAHPHLHPHLVWARIGNGALDPPERGAIERVQGGPPPRPAMVAVVTLTGQRRGGPITEPVAWSRSRPGVA